MVANVQFKRPEYGDWWSYGLPLPVGLPFTHLIRFYVGRVAF